MLKRFAFAVFAATLAAALRPAPAAAQKALVYCPATIDGTGCNRIVDALGPRFAEGVDRGYDGSNGTVDLRKVDLQHYSVVVVPSLADNDASKPFALLREVAPRFKMAINGRVAVYAGAPDQGGTNREAKNSLITNLATWASGGHKYTTGLVGLVAFLDLSADAASRYDWVRAMSPADVSADADLQSFGAVDASGDASLSIGGSAIKYGNMASLGLHIGKQGAVHSVAAATAGATKKAVLVKYSLTPDVSSEGASYSRAKVGGASFSTSGSEASAATTSGPTLNTDKQDYMPGETVTFRGSGFAPNDTVVITLHEDPAWIDPDRTVTAIADATGAFTNSTFVVDQHDFGVTFTATAVGSPSGLTAQHAFTDGIPSTNVGALSVTAAQNPNPVPPGQSATYTVSLVFTGNATNCTVALTATPAAQPPGSPAWPAPLPAGFFTFGSTLTGNGSSGGSPRSTTLSVAVPAAMAAGTYNFTIGVSYPLNNNCQNDNQLPTASAALVVGVNSAATVTNVTAASTTYGTSTVILSASLDVPNVNVGTMTFTLKQGQTTIGTAATVNVASSAASTSYGIPAGTSAGDYSIEVGYSGGTGYKPSAGSAALKINATPLTVVVDNQTREYNTANPVFTGTVTGVVSGDGITASYGTTATQTSDVGTYAITATLTDPNTKLGNYAVTNTPGTLTITQASQTITFGAPSGKTYGDADFALDATASSGLGVSYATTTPATCTIANDGKLHIVAAGSCTVNADQAGNTNYKAAPQVGRTFTINKKAASVTPNPASKTYGDPDPSFTGTLAGFVASDNVTATYSRTGGETVAGSPYTISAVLAPAGVLGNYDITYKTAAFTIYKKAASVTPNVASKNYGDADPAFSGSLSGFLGGDNVVATYTRSPSEDTPTTNNNVAPSSYTISATLSPMAVLGNYDITYNTASYTINNDVPIISSLTGPAAPVALGSQVAVTGAFTDHGFPGDVYTISSTWTAFGTNLAVPNVGASSYNGNSGNFSITAPSSIAAGVYTVTVTVKDKWQAASTPMTLTSYVVVYNASGGFVTGGGWITADPGSCVATYAPTGVCTATGGRANFGFVSKYEKGANLPSGNTEFQFQAGNLNFKSTDYQWLVVSGARAQYKGSGTINGQSGFEFILTAIDGTLPGGNNQDRFRIKITRNGYVVFDNQNGALDSDAVAGQSTALGGGNVSIKAK